MWALIGGEAAGRRQSVADVDIFLDLQEVERWFPRSSSSVVVRLSAQYHISGALISVVSVTASVGVASIVEFGSNIAIVSSASLRDDDLLLYLLNRWSVRPHIICQLHHMTLNSL